MRRPDTVLLLCLMLPGCTAPGANLPQSEDPVLSTAEAYEWGQEPGILPECVNGGNHTYHANGGAGREPGCCAEGQGFSLEDALGICGGPVKYYSYTCEDFPATTEYEEGNERGWTAYFACCAPEGFGDGVSPGYGPTPWGGGVGGPGGYDGPRGYGPTGNDGPAGYGPPNASGLFDRHGIGSSWPSERLLH